MNYKHTVEERFIRYAKIDTTADPTSSTFPSSDIQKDLGRLLVSELKELGAINVEMDKWGYVFRDNPFKFFKEKCSNYLLLFAHGYCTRLQWYKC